MEAHRTPSRYSNPKNKSDSEDIKISYFKLQFYSNKSYSIAIKTDTSHSRKEWDLEISSSNYSNLMVDEGQNIVGKLDIHL